MVSRSLRSIAPVRLRAKVIHGFGRGSKQLGFPTANMQVPGQQAEDEPQLTHEELAVLEFASRHETGVYCAFGAVEGLDGRVHKVALSMGWNPSFSDVKAKTIESWILQDMGGNFYGHHLRLLVLGYVRPEVKFESLEDLIAEIKADGSFCSESLESPVLAPWRSDPFLQLSAEPLAQPRARASASARGQVLVHGPRAMGGQLSAQAMGGQLSAALAALPSLQPAPGVARLLLVRHAEALANEEGRLCGGGLDSELSEAGQLQAARLASALAALGLDLGVLGHSPLRRAEASALAVARHFPEAERLPPLEGLREMAYGSLEGARIREAPVQREMATLAEQWRAGNTSCRVNGDGESPSEVAQRALHTVAELLESRPGQTLLLVCHSWVIKALVASVLPHMGLASLMDVPQRNCAVNILDFTCGGSRGGSPNPHLPLKERFRVLGIDLVAGEPSSAAGRL